MDISTRQRQTQQDPENLLAQFSLGQALYQAGRYQEALAPLEYCCRQRTDWMMAHSLLGQSYLKLGQQEHAQLILQQALALAIDQDHQTPAEELQALLASLTD